MLKIPESDMVENSQFSGSDNIAYTHHKYFTNGLFSCYIKMGSVMIECR